MNNQTPDNTSQSTLHSDTPPAGTPKKPVTSKGQLLLCLLVTVGLIIMDQITKIIAAGTLADGRSITLIKGVLEFTFVQNRGAAFGILQNALPFFIIITLI